MKKKNKRFYDKAIKYYQNGDLSKALKSCEESLSYSLKNPSILNLKGLILYQQGKLDEAITVWKINKDFNNDGIAQNYIHSAKEDEVRVELYELGEKKLKELKIDEAIKIFKKCKESDFNCIKVDTALALCYQKKGEINKCIDYMNKVLVIDKNYKVANQIKSQLIDLKAYKKESNNFVKSMVVLVGVIFICGTVYIFKDNFKDINNDNNLSMESINKVEEDASNSEDVVTEDKKESEPKTPDVTTNEQDKKVLLDVNKLNEHFENGDVDNIYYDLQNVNEPDVSDEYKGLYRRCVNLLKTSGIEVFYEKGMEEFNIQNYEKANVEFSKAYDYCDGSYLNEHIMFYKAVTLEQLNNSDEAIKLYELYYEEYPKGSYADNTLYNLSLILNNTDREKSIYYADKLRDEFSESIYFNETINQILNS
ncbi:tetratricopeptide repeat protein [Clostridium botulinum]|uniref:Tetratricopeptide repeat domain protein n=1 Tax=Clostridium botulinum (strain Eklund 17B / Type B) TaxID=935198 RepID=B2TIM6_CLOBB|nr:tetratricopeptide repeat domain protein [Clostridium botulinum B str. Eklund 17B (NRP)]MBY6977498.1 tetratricopeptide repeat protein [Clostridium botulinum]MBY7001797.1 tetratricopeptide repeat protein [Clostridium botulinum]MCR1275427.1 tetratricopeptide repeat protein [Clostridium botulinum]NFD70875.1 tetratricopeptide repeat protein [Clostridium botulinum]